MTFVLSQYQSNVAHGTLIDLKLASIINPIAANYKRGIVAGEELPFFPIGPNTIDRHAWLLCLFLGPMDQSWCLFVSVRQRAVIKDSLVLGLTHVSDDLRCEAGRVLLLLFFLVSTTIKFVAASSGVPYQYE